MRLANLLTNLLTFVLYGTLCQNGLLADVPPQGTQTVSRAIQNLHYNVSNQEQEIANLKQKIVNQESVLDSMHTEVTQLIKSAKESQKSTGAQVDTRLKAMEKNVEKLLTDLKQFKTHANDTSKTLTQIEKKLQEQEELYTIQAQQIKDLENALRHLAGALQVKAGTSSSTASADKTSGEYRVKSGDTLEKIAKDNGTTIDAIKRENNLQKDTIYPGQKLQIP